jgi:hypothetical protein
MDFDGTLTLAGALALAAFLVLVTAKRLYRILPLFFSYVIFSLATSISTFAVIEFAPSYWLTTWTVETSLDCVLFLLVFFEIVGEIARHNRHTSQSRFLLLLLFATTFFFGLVAIQWPGISTFRLAWRIAFRVMQVTTLIQTAAFLAVVCWSQLNKFRWPACELRLASGMGIWSLASLVALMLHNDGFTGGIRYHWIDSLGPLTSLCVIVWWLYYFWMHPAQSIAGERHSA